MQFLNQYFSGNIFAPKNEKCKLHCNLTKHNTLLKISA